MHIKYPTHLILLLYGATVLCFSAFLRSAHSRISL
jgi:hypothetical protein